jgi:hypothetical protein
LVGDYTHITAAAAFSEESFVSSRIFIVSLLSYLMASSALSLGMSASSYASKIGVMGAGSTGGGASCTDANGKPTTLYYCGAYQEPTATPPVIPAPLSIDGPSEKPADLDDLRNYILRIPYLTNRGILDVMQPSFTRKYFSTVAPPDLTAPIVARIKAEFQSATGINASHLTLYAVTDTQAHMDNYADPIQVTYLLPAYFALPTKEQRMVALFHENLWVLEPKADYPTIIGQELAFEAVMTEPNNTARLLDFVKKMEGDKGSTPGTMTLNLREDIESGALKGFIDSNGNFTNLQLFGKDTIDCINHVEAAAYDISSLKMCAATYLDYLDSLRRTYPKSNFLALVGDEAKKLFAEETSFQVNPSSYTPDLLYPSAAFFNLVSFANGDNDAAVKFQGAKYENWNAYKPGTTHLCWSLAEKDSNGGIVVQEGNLGPHLTTDLVVIHVDTSDNGAQIGPLSTTPTPFPSDPAGGARMAKFDDATEAFESFDDYSNFNIEDPDFKKGIPLTDIFGDHFLNCVVKQSHASDDPSERLKLLQQVCYPMLDAQFQVTLQVMASNSQVAQFLQSELTPSMDKRGFGIFEFNIQSCTNKPHHKTKCTTTQSTRIDDLVRNVSGGASPFDGMVLKLDESDGTLYSIDSTGSSLVIPLYRN